MERLFRDCCQIASGLIGPREIVHGDITRGQVIGGPFPVRTIPREGEVRDRGIGGGFGGRSSGAVGGGGG